MDIFEIIPFLAVMYYLFFHKKKKKNILKTNSNQKEEEYDENNEELIVSNPDATEVNKPIENHQPELQKPSKTKFIDNDQDKITTINKNTVNDNSLENLISADNLVSAMVLHEILSRPVSEK